MKKLTAMLAAATLLCTSLTGCFFNPTKTYSEYIQAVLDCDYFCITDKYMELTDSTPEEAEDCYYGQVEYVTWLICEYKGVVIDYLSDDTYAGYEDLAMRVMEQASYSVEPAVKSGSTYHVTVYVDPMDFMSITYDAVDELYYTEFADRFDAMYDLDEDDPAYIALEDEYGQRVLDVLNDYVDQIGYGSTQSMIVEITEDDGLYGISDKNWMDLDDLILGIDENA